MALAKAAREAKAAMWIAGTIIDDTRTNHRRTLHGGQMPARAALEPEVNAGRLGWLRPSYVFDELRRPAPACPRSTLAAATGQPMTVLTPNRRHDFIHAADVARAIVLAVTSGRLGLLPIGSGATRQVREVVEALGATWHAPSRESDCSFPRDPVIDTAWLQTLGWAPTRTQEFFADV